MLARRILTVVPWTLIAVSGRGQSEYFFYEEAKLTKPAGGPGGFLGQAVAAAGETMVVTAPGPDGAAYVFVRKGLKWIQQAQLTASDGVPIGDSAAIAGDTIVVGAATANTSAGAAYVFVRTGTAWSQQAKLTASDAEAGDQFGISVAVYGDKAVVGAKHDDYPGKAAAGSAYVFVRTGATWAEHQKLTPGDSATASQFGAAVAISSDTMIIGAPFHEAAYVFVRTGTVWTQQAELGATEGITDNLFGWSVGLSGNTAIVGAKSNDEPGNNQGAAFVFVRNATNWTQEAKLTANDAVNGDKFASSVAIAGDIAVIGAEVADAPGIVDSGSAYMFLRNGSTWTQEAELSGSDSQTSAMFGTSIALLEDRVVAGAPSPGGGAYAIRFVPTAGAAVLTIEPDEMLFHTPTFVAMDTYGLGQTTATTVQFGDSNATNIIWTGPDKLVCLAPTGAQGDVVDVTVSQASAEAVEAGAFSYVGTSVASVTPVAGPPTGDTVVTIDGDYFVDLGSTTVTFGGILASIVSIDAPNTIVVHSPPGAGSSTVDVTVSGSNGAGSLTGAFTYNALTLMSIAPIAGNLQGGNTVTLTVDVPTSAADTTVTIGGKQATVTGVVGGKVSVVVPAVSDAPGAAVDVSITNSNGTATLGSAYTYTPVELASITGNVVAGSLNLDWTTDPAAAASQTVWLWLGDTTFQLPPSGQQFAGYSGTLHQVPLVFILTGLPVQFAPLTLGFGPLPPNVIGVPLPFQSLITGEGGPKGSFSNVVTLTIGA